MTNEDLEQFNWTSVDAQDLKAFLQTSTGTKVLRALALEEPELLDKGDTNEILIRSGQTRQHKHITNFLFSLTGESFEHNSDDLQELNNYPSLEDDDQWEGERINKPQQEQ
jgi:hypothetical protein